MIGNQDPDSQSSSTSEMFRTSGMGSRRNIVGPLGKPILPVYPDELHHYDVVVVVRVDETAAAFHVDCRIGPDSLAHFHCRKLIDYVNGLDPGIECSFNVAGDSVAARVFVRMMNMNLLRGPIEERLTPGGRLFSLPEYATASDLAEFLRLALNSES